MASWLKPLLLALLAALLLHVFGLIGIGSQLQTTHSALAHNTDPLFTRTIEAASPPAQLPPEPPPPEPAPPRAPSAPLLSQPVVTETLAIAPPAPTPPEPAEITPAVAAATPSISLETTTAAISKPSQTLSAEPAGQTDSLLVSGQWPADTRVSYVMTGFFNGELHGRGQVQWTRSGLAADRYQVRVVVDAALVELRITSQGRVSPQGLLPEVFEEYLKIALREARIRPLKLEANELILGDGRRIQRPAADPMAVQDTVSQFIDLGHRFQQGRAKLETGQTVTIWLGRPGGLDQWIYDVGAEETIYLPRIGPVSVFPLKPRPVVNARGTITMSMWLAPSLQYLPAKIRIDVNTQTHVELLAERLEQR